MVNFYSQINRQNNGEKKPDEDLVNHKKAEKPNIKKFSNSTEGLDAQGFGWALLYVKHKLLLYRLGVGSLIFLCCLTIGFTLWKAFNILYFDLTAGRVMDQQLAMSVNYSALQPRFAPAPLQILNTFSLINGKDKIDALSHLQNPNIRHIVYFDYYFDFGANTTQKQSGFLLPMESRPIVAFGLDSYEFVGVPNLVLENIRWKRVSAHEIIDVASWQEERINFLVRDFIFGYASQEGVLGHSIEFELTNNSAYGYRNPVFILGLFQNQNLIGIMRFDLVDFESLETKKIDLRNYAESLSVNEISIYPVIDLYNREVYLLPRR